MTNSNTCLPRKSACVSPACGRSPAMGIGAAAAAAAGEWRRESTTTPCGPGSKATWHHPAPRGRVRAWRPTSDNIEHPSHNPTSPLAHSPAAQVARASRARTVARATAILHVCKRVGNGAVTLAAGRAVARSACQGQRSEPLEAWMRRNTRLHRCALRWAGAPAGTACLCKPGAADGGGAP